MATIKFSEFDSGNISAVGALLVGLESGINKKFTASDLIAGLASESYVDNEVLTLQNQITNNANDIANIADTDSQTLSWDLATSALSISNGNTVDLSGLQVKIDANFSNISILQGQVVSLESNVSVNTGDISVLQGNVVSIEAELANIADTDNQTLSYDGATASLSISNGNSVILQEVLDNAGNIASSQTDIINLSLNQNSISSDVGNNAGNITVIQGQIADLQANGNIQLLSLDNSSNVLSISGGNSVDFTTVLSAGGTAGTLQEVTDAGNTTVTNITVADVTSTGNIDAGNINVDDDILMGSGTGGSITGANSISAESLIATSNLNVAGFLVDGIIDDDTLATASATTLATSESIKVYVDASSQTLSLDNSSNVLSISGGNTVDFTTVLGNVAGDVPQTLSWDTANANLSISGGNTVTLDGLGGNSNIAIATASDGQDYLTTFDTSFFITADPTATDIGYIAMGESSPQTWGSGSFVLHGSGLGQSVLSGKTITNKIGHNGPHLGIAAFNDIYLGTRYAALYTDSSYDITLSSDPLGHVALAIDDVDKLVVDGATDKVIIETDLDVNGSGTHTFEGTLEFTQLSNFGGSVGITALLDEDDMVSDSATALATQQSIKAYVDANAGNPFDQDLNTTDTPEFQGVTATTGTVRLANLTTTERNALTAANGDMVYNITDSKLQGYQAGAWINLDGS